MKGGTVYIVTDKTNGVLCTGVTSDLVGRIFEHREGLIEGFTKRYGCRRLVWFEDHPTIGDAVWRERRIKTWNRAWKVRLILEMNPEWRDLYPEVAGLRG